MVTLNELLASRDARHAMQQQLLADNSGKTLVCLTVVVPGSVKRNHQSLVVAHAAVGAMRDRVGGQPRRCLVCDHEARFCMRKRWHTQDEIWAKINQMVADYEQDHP